MNALTPKVNEMALSIDTLRKELGAIDPGRYPVNIGKIAVREPLTRAKKWWKTQRIYL